MLSASIRLHRHFAYVFEERALWLDGLTSVGVPHSPLWENVTQKCNYISSSPIPVNLKMMAEFLPAEEHGFVHKYFPQHWLYPSVDQASFSLNIAMVPF